MQVRTGMIDLEIEFDGVAVKGDCLIIEGFAGVQEVETTMHGRELLKLARHFLRPSVIWLCLRAFFSSEPG